ncbi:hypothetical protein R1sor_007681 [Riccia sorocarpa]|uniref:Calcium-transporting ATPase n=1 Tax=Riccia sorocarpa TaxID=122646 RepID=A0ABD3HUS6_9MARC
MSKGAEIKEPPKELIVYGISMDTRHMLTVIAVSSSYKLNPPLEGFGIGTSQLVSLLQDQHTAGLEKHGGVETVAKQLRTNLEDGIENDPAEFEKRKEAFGVNKIPSKPGKDFLVFFWEAWHDIPLIMLMTCAVVYFATGMWGPREGMYYGVSIAVAVLIYTIVTATVDYWLSLPFRSLNDLKRDAIRGGRRCKMSAFDVVVGDLIHLNIGDQVPADGLLVTWHSLTIDESSRTGESLPVHKDAKHPFLLSGCKVDGGYGTMLVTAVGTNTEWGQAMGTISEDHGEETPLQARLNEVATSIGHIGLSAAVRVIPFIRFFAVHCERPENDQRTTRVITILRNVSVAVTVGVVAVPEGLPLAVTLTLAYLMRKMLKDMSLVRHLAACETMGSVTTICCDKSGILTLNKMSVAKSWVSGGFMESDERVKGITAGIYNTLLVGICQNSSGDVFIPKDGTEPNISCSPAELAALAWGVRIGMNFEEIKHQTSIIHVKPFSSRMRRAGVAVKLSNGEVQAHWKGAAEMILELCNGWVDIDGSVKPMSKDKDEELKNVIEGMAAASLRCIAFAYKPLDSTTIPETEEDLRTWPIPDQELVFIGVIGIKDPCRPDVQEAVRECQMAGVKVRMVTGDTVMAAKAVAYECGILTSGGIVVEGKQFREWSEDKMDAELHRLEVLARASPTDKLLLVKSLKKRNQVVAVTGDGTNDAPALHEADVGLAMNICGTQIAKESSDIVIMDDNFASVVRVVRRGRSAYKNVQKVIQLQLTVSVTVLVTYFATTVVSGDFPMTAVQLLWVNLLMNTVGVLALATEPPSDGLMEETPIGRTEPLLTNVMLRNLLGQALYQITVLLVVDFAGTSVLNLNHTGMSKNNDGRSQNDEVKNTIIFNAFVFCQIFNKVNSRRPETKNIFEGLHRNYLFVGVIVVEIIFQFVIVQFLNTFATTTALSGREWGICIAIGAVSWPLGFLIKFIPVPEKPIVSACSITIKWRRSLAIVWTLSTFGSKVQMTRKVSITNL